MTDSISLSSLLTATGDVGYEWDLLADRIVWFGPVDKLVGAGAVPPGNSQAFYNVIAADDRPIVFGG